MESPLTPITFNEDRPIAAPTGRFTNGDVITLQATVTDATLMNAILDHMDISLPRVAGLRIDAVGGRVVTADDLWSLRQRLSEALRMVESLQTRL